MHHVSALSLSHLEATCFRARPVTHGRRFYEFTGGPAWEVLVRTAGHFQFLDDQSALQRAICTAGPIADARVRAVAQARCTCSRHLLRGRCVGKRCTLLRRHYWGVHMSCLCR